MRSGIFTSAGPTRAVRRPWLAAAALATLALLIIHAWRCRFLIDDAFISFRYARHLAEGQGLVFNPGGDRVEGYTNFLWVVILAALDRAGLAPEDASVLMGFLLTAGLWGLVAAWVRRAWREAPGGDPAWLAIVPLIFLAATRSVAVWSTGGLETRLYEVLVLGGALALLSDMERGGQAGGAGFLRGVMPGLLPGLLFGLAALARPDGLLVGACAFAVALAAPVSRRNRALRRLAASCLIFALLIASHYLFRRLYYGDWLPNTWYAKVGGRFWWSMGWSYLAVFALEHAAFLWAPLIAAAAARHAGRGTGHRVVLFAAIIAPHALFVASVGGDHFEYRPLDLYFPFLFILMHDGAWHLCRGRAATLITSAWLVVVLAGLVALPWLSGSTFPGDAYRGGFPGALPPDEPPASTWMAPGRLGPYDLPGLRWLGRTYARLLRDTTASFVGLRAEEHAAFLATVVPEGQALGRMVASGTLPADTHVAIDCVGAIPYYSGLRVLDRLGLTDREVARSAPIAGRRLMAHERQADVDYARRAGVDFWAMDYVHLSWNRDAPRFIELVQIAHQRRAPVYAAGLDDGTWLLAYLLQGEESARRRFPRLEFLPLRDAATVESLLAGPGRPPR